MWTKEDTLKWRHRHAAECVDCGKPCSYLAKRCNPCEHKNREQPYPLNCLDCDKPINRTKPKGVARKGRATRCQSCASKENWRKGGHTWNFKKGPDSPAWKGGKTRTSWGYILVCKPGHPRASRANYVYEHIIIWEEAHGKPLPKGWIVHHLNGIKDDNRICNLKALPGKKHYGILKAKAKRIQELEALLNGQHQLL